MCWPTGGVIFSRQHHMTYPSQKTLAFIYALGVLIGIVPLVYDGAVTRAELHNIIRDLVVGFIIVSSIYRGLPNVKWILLFYTVIIVLASVVFPAGVIRMFAKETQLFKGACFLVSVGILISTTIILFVKPATNQPDISDSEN
jgi:hypothetical protein